MYTEYVDPVPVFPVSIYPLLDHPGIVSELCKKCKVPENRTDDYLLSLFYLYCRVIGSFLYDTFGLNIMGSASAFPSLYVWSGVWQGAGYGAIIYMATLAGVDMQLHEAAIIDGATLLQRIRYIDLPEVIPTAVIMLILNMGSILNVGSEKVLAMQNQNNLSASEVINTYAYKVSLVSSFPDFSYSTAIGLFQSLVGLILVLGANKVADKVSGNGFV